MKLQGIIETDLGVFFAHIHFGQKDGRDFAQISLPVLGSMNEKLEEVHIGESDMDLIMDVNGFPFQIHLENGENGWTGKAVLETVNFQKEITGKLISTEPDFRDQYYMVPEKSIQVLKKYNIYETAPCETSFTYELGNQEVLAYIQEKGIDAPKNQEFATAKMLMSQLTSQIQQDGVNYCHDREHRGTIAQMAFAYQQNSKTNCRGMAIIFCGILRAYGFKANYVECWPVPTDDSDMHVVCEAYCEDLKKTVAFDPSSNLVYFLNEKPLSLIELKQALCDGKADEITVNEDAAHNDEQVSKTQMLAYMAKNLITLCKCIDSDEQKEMIGENCITLLPVGLSDDRMEKLGRFTNNVHEFYETK